MIGLTLGLLFVLEAAYRFQTAIKERLIPSVQATSEGLPDWMPAYLEEHQRAVDAQVWTPYVYYRTAGFSGRYINIDERGSRRTVQPTRPADAAVVFLMGGSTMFGSYQRDSGTLASTLARYFEGCDGQRPRLHNFGQSGRVFTHEVVDLLLKLRAGAVPKVVLFYDGINDVAAAMQYGEPGWPINERNRVRDFELGRDLFWWETTLRAEARAARRLVLSGAERLQLLNRLRRLFAREPEAVSNPRDDSVASDAIIKSYLGTARWVQALGHEYHFVPVFVWQPTIHTTKKTMTSREAGLRGGAGPYTRGLISLHRAVAAKIDETAGLVLGPSFVNLTTIFDNDRKAIYVDGVGHTNEEANEQLAEALGPVISAALTSNGVPLMCAPGHARVH